MSVIDVEIVLHEAFAEVAREDMSHPALERLTKFLKENNAYLENLADKCNLLSKDTQSSLEQREAMLIHSYNAKNNIGFQKDWNNLFSVYLNKEREFEETPAVNEFITALKDENMKRIIKKVIVQSAELKLDA